MRPLGSRPYPGSPDGWETFEVFTYFGLAMYYAQVLEHGIVNLLLVLEVLPAKIDSWTAADFDHYFEAQFDQTMGQLRRRLEPHLAIDVTLVDDLGQAVATRNRLAHAFWREHDRSFARSAGRQQMVQELEAAVAVFQDVDERLTAILYHLGHRFGLTQEVIEEMISGIADVDEATQNSP